jgi:hypothetical protein
MDQPFTVGGAGGHAASFEDQWIRRTIYKTQFSFPFVLKRIEVCFHFLLSLIHLPHSSSSLILTILSNFIN